MATTSGTQTANTGKPMTKGLLLLVVVLAVIFLGWMGVSLYNNSMNTKQETNFAADTAKSLEDALVKAGGVRQCTRGDAGRGGGDNSAPNYMALYEVPGNTDAAVTLIQKATKESGYNLIEGPMPPNPGSDQFYSDKTSKHSTYGELDAGNVSLIMTVYGDSKYSGDENCTVIKKDAADQDKTIVNLTVSLPSFKK